MLTLMAAPFRAVSTNRRAWRSVRAFSCISTRQPLVPAAVFQTLPDKTKHETNMADQRIMQFEYDPERLIEEVKKRPGIWNYDDISYRTMSTRLELWKEVVTELLQPSVTVTSAEMRELVLQLQRKWKSIKDAFQKCAHGRRCGKKPYIYSRQLEFLLENGRPAKARRSNPIPAGSDDSDEAPLMQKKRVRKKKFVKPEPETSDDDNNVDVPSSNEEAPVKAPKSVDELAFASVDSRSVDGAEDCDRMFLLSLLPHLKTIPEASRLSVKMELMQVLRNANT